VLSQNLTFVRQPVRSVSSAKKYAQLCFLIAAGRHRPDRVNSCLTEQRMTGANSSLARPSEAVKYQLSVSMQISKLSARNWRKYFTVIGAKLSAFQDVTAFSDLKIRVSVVRFRPWPPLNQKLRRAEPTSIMEYSECAGITFHSLSGSDPRKLLPSLENTATQNAGTTDKQAESTFLDSRSRPLCRVMHPP
jgi:hypothetical protein